MADKKNINVGLHGVNSETEIDRKSITRIYKDPVNEFFALFAGRKLGWTLVVFALASLIIPTITKIFFIPLVLLRIFFPPALQKLPLYIPKGSKQSKDPNNIVPSKFGRAIGPSEGIAYLGVDRRTGLEAWLTSGVMRRHLLYLSTTGGGKSVSLLTFSITFSLVMGSGYSYTDGKAQLDLPVDHAACALRFNRALDFLVLSYITGGIDSWNIDSTDSMLRTNTFNFYASGSYAELNEINSSLLDAEDDIWGKRAISFLNALTIALVYLRDTGEIEMGVECYLPYLNIESVGQLAGRQDLPEIAVSQLKGFIRTIPGINNEIYNNILRGQPFKSTTILDQFGYITMQIIPLMNMLSGDYSHIFKCLQGHISQRDVVINRRIQLILLPALEKSSASLASLGRISMAAQKSMMGSSLGTAIEGDVRKNLKTSATSAMSPFPSFNDEVGYYFVEGTAVAAAQSRSLWLMMVYCGQDLHGLRRLSEMASKETDQVIGNTVTKVVGYIQDPTAIEMLSKQAGEAITSQIDRMDIDHDGVLRGRHIANQVNMVSKQRVNVRDFNNLIEGEAFVLHKDTLIEISVPMIKAPELKIMVLNDFIPSPRFSKSETEVILNKFSVYKNRFSSITQNKPRVNINRASSETFINIRKSFDSAQSLKISLGPMGLAVFTAFQIEINKLLATYFTESKSYTESEQVYHPPVQNDDHSVSVEEDVSGLSAIDVGIDIDTGSNDLTGIEITISDDRQSTDPFTTDINSTITQNKHIFANVFSSGLLDKNEVTTGLTQVTTLLEPELSQPEVARKVSKSVQNIADASGYPGKTKLEKNKSLAIDLLQKLKRDLQNS
ncbi:hypothetical protein OCF84_20575 (plasmid) [Shewanella xiamenensis]|uniref:TraD/TraG TraM recognition site domain-containing protein n=1 Tax=Shewanella xiamenensis TaxID=332186 RepID=A0ABT6UHW2_9GAMM|nr:hypothetical protein [Shewanella xiamenensis]MDI5833335.1 hypothetical protein [Shewanella xiamenensis]WHF57913.1 hypothetical protein OCF84_20575 [Shewanella xiamenensis]